MKVTIMKIWVVAALLALIAGIVQAQNNDRADSALSSGQLVVDTNPYLARLK